MKNFVQPSNIIDLTAPAGGLISGQAAMFGNLFGIATKSAVEGERVAVSVDGVFTLPKVTGAGLSEGQKAYWTGTEISGTASGNSLIGHVVEEVVSDATNVMVRVSN